MRADASANLLKHEPAMPVGVLQGVGQTRADASANPLELIRAGLPQGVVLTRADASANPLGEAPEPIGVLQGVALTRADASAKPLLVELIPMRVLQGAALTIPMEGDIGHVLPLQGEPTTDFGADGEGIPSGAALQSFRSMVEQKAGMLARSGILMEAGAIAGAMSIHGFVLTMPEGPLLVRQGDVGATTPSPPTVLEMGMSDAGEACKTTLDGEWPKSKSKSLTVTTSRCAEVLCSPPQQDLDAIIIAPFCSMVPFLWRCDLRVRL